MPEGAKRYRAGDWVDDRCRPCKILRRHTILVVDGEGRPLRVLCDTCGSQHNFRGGEAAARSSRPSAGDGDRVTRRPGHVAPLALVSERERAAPPVHHGDDTMSEDLELLLRRIIREETGLTPVAPAEKWIGGELVLRPGREGVQEKSIPIETFFHKIVMVRNRLRTLEQQVNGSDLPAEAKAKLHGYITGAYGSLTSFNVLFADEADQFKGAGGE